jgi:hypothetical protein
MKDAIARAWSTGTRVLGRQWMLVAVAAVYLYAFPYFPRLKHANELPRILTTMELVERGTFRLDARMADLGSVADISTTPAGHRYQNKAPGLSVVALPVYAPLHAAFQLTGTRPPIVLVTWLLRVLLATLPTVVCLVYFRRVVRHFASDDTARQGALLAFALGSMALPLGLLFMSHALATALVGAAFAIAVAIVRERARAERPSARLVGALLGLAMLCEYQAVFAALLVAGYLLWGAKARGQVLRALLLTTLPFIGALAWYHASAFGSPLATGYTYSVDPENRVGFMGLVGFSELSVTQLLVRPDNGLLVLSPWVLLAVAGAVRIASSAEARARVGREALVAGLVVAVYCVFVAALAPEFGRAGWTVGPRYLAIAMPFFAWLAAAGLEGCLARDVLRVPAIALVLVGVGIHVLAATTYPHWPVDFRNPLVEVSWRSLAEGHAPYSLGTLAGLRGPASLAPLYLGVLGLTVALFAPRRRHLLEVVLAVVIAAAAIASFQSVTPTPAVPGDGMWRFVASTLEP